MTISYFYHDAKRRGGGGPRLIKRHNDANWKWPPLNCNLDSLRRLTALRSLHNQVGEYSNNSTMSVNGHQSNITCWQNVPSSKPRTQTLQHSVACSTEKIFFVRGESLGNSRFKEAKVIHTDNCKHRQTPAYQKQRVPETVSSTGMTR